MEQGDNERFLCNDKKNFLAHFKAQKKEKLLFYIDLYCSLL